MEPALAGVIGVLLVVGVIGVWSAIGSAAEWSRVRTLATIAVTLFAMVAVAVGALVLRG